MEEGSNEGKSSQHPLKLYCGSGNATPNKESRMLRLHQLPPQKPNLCSFYLYFHMAPGNFPSD